MFFTKVRYTVLAFTFSMISVALLTKFTGGYVQDLFAQFNLPQWPLYPLYAIPATLIFIYVFQNADELLTIAEKNEPPPRDRGLFGD